MQFENSSAIKKGSLIMALALFTYANYPAHVAALPRITPRTELDAASKQAVKSLFGSLKKVISKSVDKKFLNDRKRRARRTPKTQRAVTDVATASTPTQYEFTQSIACTGGSVDVSGTITSYSNPFGADIFAVATSSQCETFPSGSITLESSGRYTKTSIKRSSKINGELEYAGCSDALPGSIAVDLSFDSAFAVDTTKISRNAYVSGTVKGTCGPVSFVSCSWDHVAVNDPNLIKGCTSIVPAPEN